MEKATIFIADLLKVDSDRVGNLDVRTAANDYLCTNLTSALPTYTRGRLSARVSFSVIVANHDTQARMTLLESVMGSIVITQTRMTADPHGYLVVDVDAEALRGSETEKLLKLLAEDSLR